jgi:hypothetical protein
MEMANAFLAGASVDNLRAFLQKFIQKIVVYPHKISIIYIPPLISSFNGSDPGDPFTVGMVPKGGFEPPRGSPTTPSRWRVYQFHHFGKMEKTSKPLFLRLRYRCLRLNRHL